MASTLYRSVARMKLFPYVLKRDENNRILRRLQGSPLLSERLPGRCNTSFRRYSSTNHATISSTIAADIVRDCSDFNVKPFDNPNIMCHAQYHQLMECYVDRSDIRSVQNLVADMNHNGPSPTIITFSKMLAAHSKDPIRLQYKLDQMRFSGIALTGGMLGALFNAFALSGSILRVEKSLYEAIEVGYIAGTFHVFEVHQSIYRLTRLKS